MHSRSIICALSGGRAFEIVFGQCETSVAQRMRNLLGRDGGEYVSPPGTIIAKANAEHAPVIISIGHVEYCVRWPRQPQACSLWLPDKAKCGSCSDFHDRRRCNQQTTGANPCDPCLGSRSPDPQTWRKARQLFRGGLTSAEDSANTITIAARTTNCELLSGWSFYCVSTAPTWILCCGTKMARNNSCIRLKASGPLHFSMIPPTSIGIQQAFGELDTPRAGEGWWEKVSGIPQVEGLNYASGSSLPIPTAETAEKRPVLTLA